MLNEEVNGFLLSLTQHNSQVAGINYNKTADMTSVHILMQIAAQYDLELYQMDVQNGIFTWPC